MKLRGLHISICFRISLFLCCTTAAVQAQDDISFTPFYFSSEPSSVIVPRGSSTVLNCSVTTTVSGIQFYWFKDNSILDIDGNLYSLDPSGSLRIRDVSPSSNAKGTYQCMAYMANSPEIHTIVSRKANVSIAEVRITDGPEDVRDVFEGDTARFRCKIEAKGPYDIEWQKDREALDMQSERTKTRYTVFPSGTLEIKSLKQSDEGTYRCRVSNPSHDENSLEATLNVLPGQPDPLRELEFIVQPQGYIQAVIGSRMVLEVGTTEPASFTWYKDDEEINLQGDEYSTVGQGSLQIQSLDEIHTGVYRVMAVSADRSSIEATSRILALVPVHFDISPSNVYVNEGDPATLNCRAYGIQQPTVKWLNDQNVLEPGEHFENVQGHGLRIKSTLEGDSGYYQCFAENEVSSEQRTMELKVLGPGVPLPVIPEEIVTRPSTTSSSTPPNPPLIYTTVNPGNVVEPKASPPIGLTASRTTDRRTTLNWRPPERTSAPVTRYRISLKPTTGARERIIYVSGDFNSKQIRDLVPETTYNISIMAITEEGPGEQSTSITITTHEAVEVPGQPRGLSAYAVSPQSIHVSWTPPLDTFGDVLHYLLYYSLQGVGVSQETSVVAPITSYTINSLSPYSVYGFRVEAVNENGAGASSTIAQAKTFPAKPSAAPTNLTALSQSISSILLTWLPPPVDKQNGQITQYKIQYKKEGDSRSKAKNIDASALLREWEVTGLEKGTAYEFRMSAVNGNGTGPWSDRWVTGKTLRQINDDSIPPPAPANVTLKPYTRHIIVHWDPPINHNIVVQGYMLSWGEHYEKNVEEVGQDESYFTLQNLNPKSQYVVKVRAFNRAGGGPSVLRSAWTLSETTTLAVITSEFHSTSTVPPSPSPAGLALDNPRRVEASALSSTEMRVRWEDLNPWETFPSEVRSSRIYSVYYKIDSRKEKRFSIVNSTNTEVEIGNLDPFTTYQFHVKVHGRQASGRTASSGPSMDAVSTTMEAAPAGPPLNVKVHQIENSSTALLVSWSPPEKPNGRITGYLVYYTNGSDKVKDRWYQEVVYGDVRSFVVRGLQKGTEYTFKVEAQNSRGQSPESEVVVHSTAASGKGAYIIIRDDTPVDASVPLWVWLLILGLIFFILLVALLLLICVLCGCCKCCSSCCPGNLCAEACGCFGAGAGGSGAAAGGGAGARSSSGNCASSCLAVCCPCCCADDPFKEAFQGLSTYKNGATKSDTPDVLSETELKNIKEYKETDTLISGTAETVLNGPRPAQVLLSTQSRSSARFSNPRVSFINEANGGVKVNKKGVTKKDFPGSFQRSYKSNISPDHHVYAEVNRNREPVITTTTENLLGEHGFVQGNHVTSSHHDSSHTENTNVNINVRHHYDSDHEHGSVTPHSVAPIVTYPDGTLRREQGTNEPFTITFEETTTHHTVEKSVPLFDGTTYKTISNHETHAKSYSTSDASKDHNLQMMLQNGLNAGPLAIEIPSTEVESLPAITVPTVTSTSQLNAPSVESYSTGSHSMNQAHTLSSSDLQHSNRSSHVRSDNYNNDFRTDTYLSDNLRSENLRSDNYRSDTLRSENLRSNDYRSDTYRSDDFRSDNYRSDTYRSDNYRSDVNQAFRPDATAQSSFYNSLPNSGVSRLQQHSPPPVQSSSYEEQTTKRYQDYGSSTLPPRVDVSTRFAEGANGDIVRSGEMKDSYYLGGGMDEITPLQDFSNSQRNLAPPDTNRALVDEVLPASINDQQSSMYSSSSAYSSNQDSRSHDYLNQGSTYRYKAENNPPSDLAPDLGYFTVDRSEGVDRIENLRRLTRKELSQSHQRLTSPNFNTGLYNNRSYSTDHIDRGYHGGFQTIKEDTFNRQYEGSSYQSHNSFRPPNGRIQNGGIYAPSSQHHDSQYSFNNNNNSVRNLRRAMSPPARLEGLDRGTAGPMDLDQLRRSRSPPVRNPRLLRSFSPVDGDISDVDDSSEHEAVENRKKKTPLQLRHEFLEAEKQQSKAKQVPNGGSLPASKPPVYGSVQYLPNHDGKDYYFHRDASIARPLQRSRSIDNVVGAMAGRSSVEQKVNRSQTMRHGRSVERNIEEFEETQSLPRKDRPCSPVMSPPGYDYHSTGSSTRTMGMERPAYVYSSGYHSDTTVSSGGHDEPSSHSGNRPGNPNLSSFTVPGPPPHYSTTGPSRVRISAPSYSPLKRTGQPSTVKVRAQPLPVGTPRAPDITYNRSVVGTTSPGSTTRTFSTEDLNAEMQHLEGLMKDLNAITASELENN